MTETGASTNATRVFRTAPSEISKEELKGENEDLKREIAELQERNESLRGQLAVFDPCFAIKESLPSYQEAAKLLRLVTSRYPHMKEMNTSEKDQVQNFLCGLAYVWSLTQTTEPVTKFSGSWWLSEAQMWCSNSRFPGRPRTLLPALIVSDVRYHLDHSSLFVDPYRSKGSAIERDAWRRILNGGDLKPAIPVKQTMDHSIGFRKMIRAELVTWNCSRGARVEHRARNSGSMWVRRRENAARAAKVWNVVAGPL
jgi:hypothetical protein